MDQQITAVIINRKEHKLLVRTKTPKFQLIQLPYEVLHVPIGPSPCYAEGLWVPPGPADGRGDAGSVLDHGFAMVRSSHGPVHFSRQQPEAGVGELGSRRAASLPRHQRAEVYRPGHLLAHGLLGIHDGCPAGSSDMLCNAAPLWLEHLVSSSSLMFFFPVHSNASVVWCFSLHGSLLIKRHPGMCNMTQM